MIAARGRGPAVGLQVLDQRGQVGGDLVVRQRLADHAGRGDEHLAAACSSSAAPAPCTRRSTEATPALPVKALALPELTRMARALPPLRFLRQQIDRRRARSASGSARRRWWCRARTPSASRRCGPCSARRIRAPPGARRRRRAGAGFAPAPVAIPDESSLPKSPRSLMNPLPDPSAGGGVTAARRLLRLRGRLLRLPAAACRRGRASRPWLRCAGSAPAPGPSPPTARRGSAPSGCPGSARAGCGARRRLMMCQPNWLFTGAWLTSSTFIAKAASANSFTISSLENQPSSPPWPPLPLSVDFSLARPAKSAPPFSCSMIALASSSVFTRMWAARTSSGGGLSFELLLVARLDRVFGHMLAEIARDEDLADRLGLVVARSASALPGPGPGCRPCPCRASSFSSM